MFTALLEIVHVSVCFFLMLVVLLQQGKGGGMGAAFGGSATQVFGGRGAGNILTRATAICAATFMLTSVSLAYVASAGDRDLEAAHHRGAAQGQGKRGDAREGREAQDDGAGHFRGADRSRSSRLSRDASRAAALQPAMTPRRERVIDALALGTTKLAFGAWVLHTGFTHVSDDDYARTVIAAAFAHAPRLDPSGTSWLPFPFWVAGLAMMATARSLAVARVVAVVLGAAAVIAPYLAMRTMGMTRSAAWLATFVAMALPYSAWLAVATVPEGWVGAITAAALLAMGSTRARPWCAAALLGASLSRYDAWAACAVFVAFCALQARRRLERVPACYVHAGRSKPARDLLCGVAAAAGPLGWMAWNAHAHGSALHFVTRVTAFRHAVGGADAPLASKLLGYPGSLLADTPEVALLIVVGLIGIATDASVRRRWVWPTAAGAAVLAFLVAGDLGDGAPTHHPGRALSALWWLGAALGIDAAATAIARVRPSWRKPGLGVAGALLGLWLMALPGRVRAAPGESDAERRDVQIERGLSMRDRGVASAEITPCAFEHFALLAAWGAPERAKVNPRTGAPLTDACPQVEER